MGSISVTISVPIEVLQYTDRIAKETGGSRSSVVTAILTAEIQRRNEEEMALAYQDCAADNQAIAESLRPLAAKLLGGTEYSA